MVIIAEKINDTRKQTALVVQNRGANFIRDLLVRQFESTAAYLDINAGTLPKREPQDIAWLMEIVQEAAPDATLCLDRFNHHVLRTGTETAAKTPMINSLSGETFRIDEVLLLACEFQTELIVLGLDHKGIPKPSDGWLDILRRRVQMTRGGGLTNEKRHCDRH